jgi:2-keto-4-pentenoate hydratase/2-oxohepta-3-ene-1,7-dioic acid hydratase in catechol pathway
MQLARISSVDGPVAVGVDPERGVVRLAELAEVPAGDVLTVVGQMTGVGFSRAVADAPSRLFRPLDEVEFVAPYDRPRKIWGIGLNYRAHADDLGAPYPDEPASFMKGDHTVIGPRDAIPLPSQSDRVTAEAELGLVFGQDCRNVEVDDALNYVWGVCPVLDQTAEDILQRNPRFLTVAKNFPGFFSFGPGITPLHEVLEQFGSLGAIEVATIRNGLEQRVNTVADMIFAPEYLVSFHSRVFPFFPGDILSTGTPGAAVINAGDVVECRISGIGTLVNDVTA